MYPVYVDSIILQGFLNVCLLKLSFLLVNLKHNNSNIIIIRYLYNNYIIY